MDCPYFERNELGVAECHNDGECPKDYYGTCEHILSSSCDMNCVTCNSSECNYRKTNNYEELL